MKQQDRITSAFIALREQMLSLAERITGSHDDAADAVQEAFVKLWQQRDRYENDRHASGASLATVRNASIDLARRNSRHASLPVEMATGVLETVGDDEQLTAYQEVRQIIDNVLSANQRAIIDMREVDGLEFDVIAARLGMKPATVRVELSRARKRVREIYHKQKTNT